MTYDELVDLARHDEDVLGLVLTGSRATGVGAADGSDWDVRLVVPDAVRDEYRSRYETPHGSRVEIVVLGESDLEQAGELGTSSAWDRYSWVHARVVVDAEGRIAEIVERKRRLAAEDAAALAASHLDDYVNWLYRSLKNAAAGLDDGARFDAAESVSSLLGFLFAVHGRVRPFNRQLRWELEAHPLPGEKWSAAALLPRLGEILDGASVDVQRSMFRDVEPLALENGLGDVIAGWEPDVEWLRGGRSRRTMDEEQPEHGFTSVDSQQEPRFWVDVLDRVRQEPAYVAYKARIRELLRPVAGGAYLDVGSGTGDDALALAASSSVRVVGVDSSETMVAEARRRGLEEALVADTHALPFPDASFDGCWADRVFQHLANPECALAELVRVTKPGGRIVVADPDYDTQVVDVADQELARRILRFRADHLLRNGTLGHRMGGLFIRAGLAGVTVEAVTVVLRDPTALDNALGLRSWARTAHERGLGTVDDADAWERQLDESIASGRFLYSFAIFLTAGTKS